MGVQRFRSVEEMPPPWRPADDPGNLRAVAAMMALYRLLAPASPPGVRRFSSVEEADAESQGRSAPDPPRPTAPGG
ncbi:MAG: hypothetical protein MUF10_10480 [Thermoanaerobaculaceae bacterium]|nr:hypothetical protein [Thermoanaerobaculaceae bacterium]